MNKTTIGLLDTQVSALKSVESEKEENLIILEIARLLLDNVKVTDSAIDSSDKLSTRTLFASYGSIGSSVCDFYEGAKTYLDPTAASGAIGNNLSEVTEKIERVNCAFNELERNEKELLEKEEDLIAAEMKLNELKKRTEHLHELEKSCDCEIDEYKNDIYDIQNRIQTKDEVLKNYKALLGENNAIVRSMQQKEIKSMRDVVLKVNELIQKIDLSIKELEDALLQIVLAEEEHRNEILKMQNKRI